MTLEEQYFEYRQELLSNPDELIKLEKDFTEILLNEVILPISDNIHKDFSIRPQQLVPFWKNYPPEQRGRQPKGTSIPWLELGEKTTSSNIIGQLAKVFPDITYAGLPTGGDIRFTTGNFYIHLDIKLTGPNDNPNEVVVPPNQVSGDGEIWNDGVLNNSHPIVYLTSSKKGQVNYNFQPKLPPIYILDNQPLICLTFFLETVYEVESLGMHPLKYLELSCVPNGLLLFETKKYCNLPGLLIAGKDDKTKADDTKRIRIRLKPLAKIDNWRSIKILKEKNDWIAKYRISKK